jgi:hypothetical protein
MALSVQPMYGERLQWLCERAGCQFTESLRGIEAVDERGVIRGAVGFDGWLGNAAQMHIALESPIALRALLRPAFDYLYDKCGKDIALGMVPAHNHRALDFDKHIGFREAFRLKDGWAPNDDMILLELRRENCKWLKEKSNG